MPHPFEQQPKESAKAFAAFAEYLNQGPTRSLEAVGQKLGKSVSLIERWSSRWNWTERVLAHAEHLAIVEREATEALTRGKSAEWLTRREKHREEEWAWRGELIEAAQRVLGKFKDGSRGATLGDVARAFELASKLGRLASGLATEMVEHTGEGGGAIKVEFAVALKKIYGAGEPVPRREPAAVVDVEAAPVAAEKERAGVGVSTN